MKKFTLLSALVCLIAMCLPQRGWAQETPKVTVQISAEGVATITSTEAGALSANRSSFNLDGATGLVFVGPFNAADLNSVRDLPAVKVDMKEAMFPTATSGSSSGIYFTLYTTEGTPSVSGTTVSGTTVGEYAATGGTLYRATRETNYEYNPIGNPGENATREFATRAAYEAFLKDHNGDPEYSYYKIASYDSYYQIVDDGHSGKMLNSDGYNYLTADQKNAAIVYNGTYDELSADFIDHPDNYEKGDIYKIVETNKWYIKEANGTTFSWVGPAYVDGQSFPVSYFFADDTALNAYTAASDGQYALVGAGIKVYSWDGSAWSEVPATTMYDWSQMRFDYWKDTIKEAVTSQYVTKANGYSYDEANHTVTNGLSRDIFDGCTNLTKVTYMSGNAIGFQDKQTGYALKEVIFGEGVTWINDGAFQRATLTTFSFTNPCATGGLDLIIDNGAFAEATKAEIEGYFPNRLKTIGQRAFYGAKVGKFEVCEENGKSKLETITKRAFASSSLSELVVPRSVATIDEYAFQATNNLSKISFATGSDDVAVTIKTGSFTGGDEGHAPVLDVFLPKLSERKVICEYDAFNFTQMVGQTSTSSTGFSKLHFDEDEAWDYYQGNWKRGLAFDQSNLNAFKDGYYDATKKYYGKSNGTIDSSTGKYEYTGDGDGQHTPANGWQQFARTITGIDIDIPSGTLLRTYSTLTSYKIPKYAEASGTHSAGEQMFKAYRITNFADGYTDQDVESQSAAETATPTATATEVEDYLPANTGLILSGSVPYSYLVYLEEAEDVTGYAYNQDVAEASANLLYPTCIDGGNTVATVSDVSYVIVNPTMPYPIGTISGYEDAKYRIFTFKAADRKFLRVKPNVRVTRDKAYLKLPVSLFHWANEGGQGTTSGLENDPSGAKGIELSFDLFDNSGETTGITNVNTGAKVISDGAIYDITGRKMENNTQLPKGIYIINGKKYLVK